MPLQLLLFGYSAICPLEVPVQPLVRAAHEAQEQVGDAGAVLLAGLLLLIARERDEVAAVRDGARPVVGRDPRTARLAGELAGAPGLALSRELADAALAR